VSGQPPSLKHSHFEFPLNDSASKVRDLELPLPSRQEELSVIALLLQPLRSSLFPNRSEASASLHPRHILIATSQLASRSE
jgi:hypothetical protein